MRRRERLVRFDLYEAVSADPAVAEQIHRVRGLVVKADSAKEAEDIAVRFLEGSVHDIQR